MFATLAQMAGEAAAGGHAVIADATFIDPRHRAMLDGAAQAAGVPFLGLWLEAPLPVLEARISGRQHDASDATVDVLHAAQSHQSAGRRVGRGGRRRRGPRAGAGPRGRAAAARYEVT